MKWARLMFGREFRVEAVLLLWDHIFASLWIEGRPDIPECIESVAVAMVRACMISRHPVLTFLLYRTQSISSRKLVSKFVAM